MAHTETECIRYWGNKIDSLPLFSKMLFYNASQANTKDIHVLFEYSDVYSPLGIILQAMELVKDCGNRIPKDKDRRKRDKGLKEYSGTGRVKWDEDGRAG